MKAIRLPTQAELDAVDPAELAAGLKEINFPERLMGIQFRKDAAKTLWEAFCLRWKLQRPDKRTHRGGTRKYLLANVRVSAAEIGVTQHTIEKALRTGRVSERIVEGMLVLSFIDWSFASLEEQVEQVKFRLDWWKKHPAPALAHGQRGAYEAALREAWEKRKKVNSEQCSVNSGERKGGKA